MQTIWKASSFSQFELLWVIRCFVIQQIYQYNRDLAVTLSLSLSMFTCLIIITISHPLDLLPLKVPSTISNKYHQFLLWAQKYCTPILLNFGRYQVCIFDSYNIEGLTDVQHMICFINTLFVFFNSMV